MNQLPRWNPCAGGCGQWCTDRNVTATGESNLTNYAIFTDSVTDFSTSGNLLDVLS